MSSSVVVVFCVGGFFDIGLSRRTGPGEDAVSEMLDMPGGAMCEGIMASPEIAEVVGLGGPPCRVVTRVVDVTRSSGVPAGRRTASLVSRREVSEHGTGSLRSDL